MLKPVISNASPMNGPAQIDAVANFAEQGWNFRVGTAAARAALSTAEKFIGLTWQDTDAGQFRRVWDGTAWKLRNVVWGRTVAATTDSSGLVPVPHPLGAVPDWVTVSAVYSGNVLWDPISEFVVWQKFDTYVVIRARRNDDHSFPASQGVNFSVSMGMQ